MKKSFIIFLTGSTLLGAVFYFVPEIDLWAVRILYERGQGFFFLSRSSTRALPFLPWITQAFVGLACALLGVNAIRKKWYGREEPLLTSNRNITFLLLTLGLGPGLLVNTVIKNHSGRARPVHVQEFGGDKKFTPAFVISDQCKRNCSFVSGDAALGYFGLAFVFVVRRRKIIACAGVLAGTLLGLVRMAQGAHFLSDVIFAGVFTLLVAWLLYFIILYPHEKQSQAKT